MDIDANINIEIDDSDIVDAVRNDWKQPSRPTTRAIRCMTASIGTQPTGQVR